MTRPVLLGACLAVFAILSWMLCVMPGDLAWNLAALGWAADAFIIASTKVLYA